MAKVTPKSPSSSKASPLLSQGPVTLQHAGSIRRLPLGLDEQVKKESVEGLQQVLVDTLALRDLYKKHHWQAAGPTFYQLHLLFDKHYEQQVELADAMAERIQLLGGVALSTAQDVVERTRLERAPPDAEVTPTQLSRLLTAHETILKEARELAHKAAERGDDGTNDVLVSQVVRTNEMQVWFVAEHLVDTPLVRTEAASTEEAMAQPEQRPSPETRPH